MARTDSPAALIGGLILTLFDARRRELGYAVGRPRYGWKCEGPKGCRRLVPDLEQRSWGKKILELRERGFRDHRGRRVEKPSWEAIAIFLIHHNVELPGGTVVSKATIQRWAEAETQLQELEARQQEGAKCS